MMPPQKKPKLSTRATLAQDKPSVATSIQGETSEKLVTDHDLINDPWTDEQETSLLKGVVRWKPVGMHKHFRMLAISEYMKSQGYAPPSEEHTRIPGIWKKLRTLYNLPALDEREDSIITEDSDESEYCPFELPEDEYGELMFSRRLAAEQSASPATSGRPGSRRGSTAAGTDEPRSSPAPPRGRGANHSRQTTRRTRSTRLQIEMVSEKSPSDNASAAGEDEQLEEAADGEEGEEDMEAGKEEGEAEEDVKAEAASSPAIRNTRTQSSRSKQKDKTRSGVGASTAAGTRRTGRRR